MSNKYSEGKIYKIVCNTTGLVYIGSTYKQLNTRLKEHKKCFDKYINNLYNHMLSSYFVLIKNNYEIILIENFPCNTQKELLARELYYMSIIDCVNYMRFSNNNQIYDYETRKIINKERDDIMTNVMHNIVQKLGNDVRPILYRVNFVHV